MYSTESSRRSNLKTVTRPNPEFILFVAHTIKICGQSNKPDLPEALRLWPFHCRQQYPLRTTDAHDVLALITPHRLFDLIFLSSTSIPTLPSKHHNMYTIHTPFSPTYLPSPCKTQVTSATSSPALCVPADEFPPQ